MYMSYLECFYVFVLKVIAYDMSIGITVVNIIIFGQNGQTNII